MKLTLTEKDIKRAIAIYYREQFSRYIPEEVVNLDCHYNKTSAEIDFDKAEVIAEARKAAIDAQLGAAFAQTPVASEAPPEKSEIIRDDPILFSGRRLSEGDSEKF